MRTIFRHACLHMRYSYIFFGSVTYVGLSLILIQTWSLCVCVCPVILRQADGTIYILGLD